MKYFITFVLMFGLGTGVLKAQELTEKNVEKPFNVSINTILVSVMDMDKSIEFYQKAFGFKVSEVLKDGNGVPNHAGFTYLGKSLLMIAPESPEGGFTPLTGGFKAPFNFYVYVRDVDGFHAQAWAEGAEVLEAPGDQFWGDRTTLLKDINGYRWMFASYIGPQ
jgi:PhnB protein